MVIVNNGFTKLSTTLRVTHAHHRMLIVSTNGPEGHFTRTSRNFLKRSKQSPTRVTRVNHRRLLGCPATRFIRSGTVHTRHRRASSFSIRLRSNAACRDGQVILTVKIVSRLPSVPKLTRQ